MAHLGVAYGLNQAVEGIISEIVKKIKQWKGVETESASLQRELDHLVAQMDVYLKNWRDAPRDPVRRVDFEVMRDLVHDMDDCIELFLYQINREKGSRWEGILPTGKNLWKKTSTREKFCNEIKAIRRRADEAARARRAGDHATAPVVPPEADPPVHRRVDIPKAMMEELRALLQDEARGEPRKRKVVSIVGFGGSGKTTLVRAVYDQICSNGGRRFPLCAWVDRADYNGVGDLLRCIILNFWEHRGDVPEGTNVRILTEYVTLHLRKNRYLIVLDDMDPGYWESIKSVFIDNGTSSRIVVTTTRMDMAMLCSSNGNGFVYKMRTLGDSVSKKVAFPDGGASDDPHSSEQELLKKCNGHPLALVSVANNIRSRTDGTALSNHCRSLCMDLGSFLQYEATEMNLRCNAFADLRGLLMDHYVGLPGNTIRPCLLYLGIFPDGRRLMKNKVIRRWVAEGYAEPNIPVHSREKVASDNFQELIDRNIIQPVGISSSRDYKSLRIAQEFVLHRSIFDKFIMHFNNALLLPAYNGERKVRHIFVSGNDEVREINLNVDLSRVRSLTVSGRGGAYLIPRFTESMLMRVLDLEECTDVIENHLQHIWKLWNLRYLSLGSRIGISRLPEKVTKLDRLESLHLSKEEEYVLPLQVLGMSFLIHLIGKFQLSYKEDERSDAVELSRKSKLETVAGFVAGGQNGFLQLMPEMRRLRKVKIWCDSSREISNLDTQLSQAIQIYTRDQHNLSLSIDFEGLTADDIARLQNRSPNANNCSNLFEVTSNINYLSSLKLQGNLSALPRFITTVRDLSKVCLSVRILTNDLMSTLSRLLYLDYLKLITDRIEADLVIRHEEFKILKSLCIEVRDNHQGIPQIEVQEGALPELVSLQLLCSSQSGLSGIRHLKKLWEIELHPDVNGPVRRQWEAAARSHPNKPNVLPLVSVDDHDEPRPSLLQRFAALGALANWLFPSETPVVQ